MRTQLCIAMLGVTAAASAQAQTNGGEDAATALRKSFHSVSGWVTKAADMVPAEKYSYKPVATVRSFGEIIAHIADSYIYYCGTAAGKEMEESDAIEKGKTDKATLVAKLKASVDGCNAAYASGGKVGPLIDNIGHTNLHYGNIITYLRMLGMVPPST